MYERGFTKPEDVIDGFLARGDIAAAEAFVSEALERPGLSRKDRHHLGLKRVTLPLFELAHGTDDERAYDEANDAYAEVGELLERELEQFSRKNPFNIGEISEQTFLALHLGTSIDDRTPLVILPASRRKDKKGTDFYFSPVGTGKVNDGWPVQVKTVAKEEDKGRYGHVTLIGMADLDPYARNPQHPYSLACCILRELRGEATDYDHQRLDAARQKTYEMIADQEARRGIPGALSRTAWQLVRLRCEPAA